MTENSTQRGNTDFSSQGADRADGIDPDDAPPPEITASIRDRLSFAGYQNDIPGSQARMGR